MFTAQQQSVMNADGQCRVYTVQALYSVDYTLTAHLAHVQYSSNFIYTYILNTYCMYVCNLLKSGNKLKSGKEMTLHLY